MTKDKPLTKSELIAALKEIKVVTQPNLISTLKEVKVVTQPDLDSTLKKMGVATKDDLKDFATKGDIKNFATKDDLKDFATKDSILASERRIKLRIGKVRNELAQRIAQLATSTPTAREFDKLKRKVEERYVS